MSTKIEAILNRVVIALFCLFIGSFGLLHVVWPDQPYSFSERRQLKERPSISLSLLRAGQLSESAENYLLDHFPMRDQLRTLHAGMQIYPLQMNSFRDIFKYQDHLLKIEYPLRPVSVQAAARLINDLSQGILSDMSCYYAIIPDKNYYLPDDSQILKMNYNQLFSIMSQSVSGLIEIELADRLSLNDYYKTDLHWDQIRLLPLAAELAANMKQTTSVKQTYVSHSHHPFFGAWHGQWALPFPADDLKWLISERIEKATAFYHFEQKEGAVYLPDALNRPDAYDLFLDGAQPLITLTVSEDNKEAGNTLYLFRDSFGSSLAPLLLAYYDEIILIDLRYVSAGSLPRLIEFKPDADVLFLYSSNVLNNSDMLRR